MTNQFGSGLSSHPSPPLRSAPLRSASRRNFKLPHSRTSCLTPSLPLSLSRSLSTTLPSPGPVENVIGEGVAELPVVGPQAPWVSTPCALRLSPRYFELLSAAKRPPGLTSGWVSFVCLSVCAAACEFCCQSPGFALIRHPEQGSFRPFTWKLILVWSFCAKVLNWVNW